VLIPVKQPVNGASIEQMAIQKVTYYRVKLPQYSLLPAEVA
jgi:hypothetical protein